MRRRLTIARSLVNEPTLLLLDKPTTGLTQARHLLWDRLFSLRQGVTLVLTTTTWKRRSSYATGLL